MDVQVNVARVDTLGDKFESASEIVQLYMDVSVNGMTQFCFNGVY